MQNNNKNNKGRNKNPLNFLPYIIVALFLALMFFNNPLATSQTQQLDYAAFNKLVETGDIKTADVVVDYNTIKVSGTYESKGAEYTYFTTIPNTENNTENFMEKLSAKGVAINVADANQSSLFTTIITSVLPLVAFAIIGIILVNKIGGASGNKQAFDFSKSRARLEDNIKVRFADVAGCDEEKEEMAEIIDYLKSPRKFAQMGARIPKGILLVGSPGTGKTLLAKAVAGEANVPFYSISGSDFVEMFVGVGASRVRDMFAKAKKTAPCMIFIDEIDAVGRQRGAGMGGGHDEREQTLNQMLVEMDGMADNNGVVVIAATNRPDVLDPALLRPGRFDRQITVSLPDLKGREAILKVHARNKKLDQDVDLEALARRTPGFSGADLENVLNEAAILSVRENKEIISLKQVDEAIDRVMMGPAKKSRTYDEHTKKLVAYHEAGHAIVGLNLPDGAIVQKVTIIPRGNAGGYNLITPRKERILNSRKELIDTITSYMGGRSAEELFFDDITTGASGDIQAATRIAKDMVTTYGMSELGPIQYDNGNGTVFLGRDYNSPANASSQVAYEIDTEVRKIIDYCHDYAKRIIKAHKDDLVKIAEALIANETLTAEEIQDVLDNKLVVKDGKLVRVEKEEPKQEKVETVEDNKPIVAKKTVKKTVKKETKKTTKK
ncbi:MAG: ATP-dependent zinc metalloprotease FtsH [Erysipelotrichaceae bacterium]|nr:ATP-dependent zinc metalloprotease FtsH [Erysipelotrichaceae bacterium]